MFNSESTIRHDGFEKLYNLYYKPGIAFLVSIIKDKEEAENMLQDVFLKIWLRREKLELDINLQPYIFTSLRNIAFDYFKKMEKSNQMKLDFLERMKEPQDVNEESDDIVKTQVNKAIDKLSEKRKMIIKLNIEEGKSYHEIAEMLRISKNTVKNQLIKAKQHLRNNIEYPIVLT